GHGVVQGLSYAWIVGPSRQVHERGLSRAGGSNDADRAPRRALERDVFEDRPGTIVGKRHMLKDHGAGSMGQRPSVWTFLDIDCLVQQRESPFGAYKVGLHACHFLANRSQGPVELS